MRQGEERRRVEWEVDCGRRINIDDDLRAESNSISICGIDSGRKTSVGG